MNVMNIAVVGYGTEGKASADYFARLGHAVTVCDKNAETQVPDEFEHQLGSRYLSDLDGFDVVVRSAGIHPDVLTENNPGIAPKITTAINEFLAHSPTQNVIGITGTKGKGTTSTLIAEMLKASDNTTWLGGNIGRSPLEFIDKVQPTDWVVLELSSFQLADLRHSPHIAVCLMVVPEHLDWHGSFDNYVHAKTRLFQHQQSNDIAIYYGGNDKSEQIATASPGAKIPYYESPGAFINGASEIEIDGTIICSTHALKLLGKHNWQNACAAVTTVWETGLHDVEPIKSVLTSFAGLPHRLELVREIHGLRYFNDSFAATPDASMAALSAIPGDKVLIAGGFDRGLPLTHFANALKENTKDTKVLLVGESAGRLATECATIGLETPTVCQAKTMKAIVEQATYMAIPGSAIILSPGFASFDMFRNFEDRGNQFKEVVNQL